MKYLETLVLENIVTIKESNAITKQALENMPFLLI